MAVTTEDIAAFWLYTDTVSFQAVCHFCPVLLLCRHDVEGFADDSKSYGEGDSAYGVILYTYGSGKDIQYMGNVGKVTFESPMDLESEPMSQFLFGKTTSAAPAWSTGAVPEPTSGLLMLLGMAGLALRRRRA